MAGVFHLVVGFGAALVEAVDPDAALLEVFERAIDVGDADHGQVLERAGRGFGDHVGDAGGAALGNDDGAGAGGVGGADDGAQIVRIFHAIEHHEHLAGCDGFEVGVLARGAQGDHALVRGRAGQAVQRGARLRSARAHRRGAPGR